MISSCQREYRFGECSKFQQSIGQKESKRLDSAKDKPLPKTQQYRNWLPQKCIVIAIAASFPERNNQVLEIIIQGRGGQGAQTAGNLLASAFHAQGLYRSEEHT